MHPGSCHKRQFYPLSSQPAELLDYYLHFFSTMGIAEAVFQKGTSMHGVLHRVTTEQMNQLDVMEVNYIRRIGQVRIYGTGKRDIVPAFVYCRPIGTDTTMFDQAPRQRYLEIMIAGAKHWGVNQEYIQMLQNHHYQPRPSPNDFLSLGDPPAPLAHYSDVPESTPDTIFMSLNGKIIQFTFPKDHFYHDVTHMLRRTYGPHLEIGAANTLYDLKYGVPQRLKDFTKEHSGMLEDNYARYVYIGEDNRKHVKVIGTFEQVWAIDD